MFAGVVSVDINQTGTVAASSSLDSHIRFWNLETGSQVKSIDAGPVDAWTVCYSPDSKLVATGSHSGKINLYNVESGSITNKLDTTGKFTLSIAFVSVTLLLVQRLIAGLFSHLMANRLQAVRWMA